MVQTQQIVQGEQELQYPVLIAVRDGPQLFYRQPLHVLNQLFAGSCLRI